MLIYYIYILFSPIITLLLFIISPFNNKIRANLFSYKQLNQFKQVIDNNKKPILLFHAASAGEFEQIQPILKRIDRNKYFIVQSFTSPSIYEKKNTWKKFVDFGCYQPFDCLIGASDYFFNLIKPSMYIISRHDIWPKHIIKAKKLGVKILFLNANIHKNSLWKKPIFKTFTKFIFNKINFFILPSQNIKMQIQGLIPNKKIKVIHDTRFAQVIDRASRDSNGLINIKSSTMNIIFASIDETDEEIIFNSLKICYPNGQKDLLKMDHKLIFVPHEVNSITLNRLTTKIKQINLIPTLYNSSNQNISLPTSNIIIIAKVGILAELYKYANLSYIGGGFSKGVHSVLEPAIYDNVIVCGPNIEMLDEAKEMLKQKILAIVNNYNDLVQLMNIKNYKQLSKKSSKQFVLEKRTSIKEVIKIINEIH